MVIHISAGLLLQLFKVSMKKLVIEFLIEWFKSFRAQLYISCSALELVLTARFFK